ncbi:MAG TPA: DUF4383 domain-containing protein [Burkholderiales bacterium]|nr:DUF4383 domain-containing protein [Burkholderiales bacterium]
MKAATFALIAGAGYLAIGLLGLVPVALAPPPADAPSTTFALLYGSLLGLWPVNVLHSALHIALGFWGLCAWSERCGAVAYARGLAVLFAVLTVLGLLPGADTLFGIMPIHGNDVWLHGLTAAAAFYFGWRPRAAAKERRHTPSERRRRTVAVARERRFGLADRREGFAA